MSEPQNTPKNPLAFLGPDQNRSITLISYILVLGSLVTAGFLGIAGFILALVKQREARDTVWESHLTWIIRTFAVSFVASIISYILMIMLIGYFTLLATVAWMGIRMVMGLLKALKNEPIDNPESWFFS